MPSAGEAQTPSGASWVAWGPGDLRIAAPASVLRCLLVSWALEGPGEWVSSLPAGHPVGVRGGGLVPEAAPLRVTLPGPVPPPPPHILSLKKLKPLQLKPSSLLL